MISNTIAFHTLHYEARKEERNEIELHQATDTFSVIETVQITLSFLNCFMEVEAEALL